MNRTIKYILAILIIIACPYNGYAQSEPAQNSKNVRDNFAVASFENKGKECQWLSKGIMDMLITDLSKCDSFRIIERERMQRIIKELKLGLTGLVDEATAKKIGEIGSAKYVLYGSYIKQGEKLTIEAVLMDIETGKELAFKIINNIDIKLSLDENMRIKVRPTNSLNALQQYYEGLEYFDGGNYQSAFAAFMQSKNKDSNYDKPRFSLAKIYYYLGEYRHSVIEYVEMFKHANNLSEEWEILLRMEVGRICMDELKDYRTAEEVLNRANDIFKEKCKNIRNNPNNNTRELKMTESDYLSHIEYLGAKIKELLLFNIEKAGDVLHGKSSKWEQVVKRPPYAHPTANKMWSSEINIVDCGGGDKFSMYFYETNQKSIIVLQQQGYTFKDTEIYISTDNTKEKNEWSTPRKLFLSSNMRNILLGSYMRPNGDYCVVFETRQDSSALISEGDKIVDKPGYYLSLSHDKGVNWEDPIFIKKSVYITPTVYALNDGMITTLKYNGVEKGLKIEYSKIGKSGNDIASICDQLPKDTLFGENKIIRDKKGIYWAIWQTIFFKNNSGKYDQLMIASSSDCKNWSKPVELVNTENLSEKIKHSAHIANINIFCDNNNVLFVSYFNYQGQSVNLSYSKDGNNWSKFKIVFQFISNYNVVQDDSGKYWLSYPSHTPTIKNKNQTSFKLRSCDDLISELDLLQR